VIRCRFGCMSQADTRNQLIRFGVFELDLATGRLSKNGAHVKLQEQPFQVLAALLEKRGEVVTKEELQERIWKDDTFVDFDRSLATAINKVRQALGDSASHPRFVETIPRRGYRFLADVSPAASEASVGRPGSVRLAFVWAAGLVVAIAAAAFLLGRMGTESNEPPTAFVAMPLTSFLGGEYHPAISPGGDRVAFVRGSDEPAGSNADIWVQPIGGDDDPIRLTTDPLMDWSPTWSPDGNYVAFLRGFPGRSDILRIPAIGGPEQKLGEVFFPAPISAKLLFGYTFLDWSPDGRYLAVAQGPTGDQRSPQRLEVATGDITPLLTATDRFVGSPAYSPNGRSIAFTMSRGIGNMDVWLQGLSEDGEPLDQPRRLTSHESWMFGLDWTPDGREIVFVSMLGGVGRFWRVSTEPDEPEVVQISGRDGLQLSIDPQSRRLVFMRLAGDTNIWSLPGPLAPNSAIAPKRIVASTRDESSVNFSPDGERIVFSSNRTGHSELWTAQADGTNVNRITSLNGPVVGSPRWSRDGRFIAFDSNIEGPLDVYVVRSEGGDLRRVTRSKSLDFRPSWSRDDQSIYFLSNRSGKPAVWKTPVGGGEALQVTQDGGARSYETVDGSLYYNAGGGNGGVMRLRSGTDNPEQILTGVEQNMWAAFDGGICFVPDAQQNPRTLAFYDFSTGEIARFAELPKDWMLQGSPGISVSPDGQKVVLGVVDDPGGDIMLVDGFR